MRRIFHIAVLLLSCWSLRAQYATELFVAADGSAEYGSIQAAIDATKSFPDQDITIYIAAGVYEEKVRVPAWNTRLRLRGEGADVTIIRWGDHFDAVDRGRNSTFMTATLLVQAEDFIASDLTVENKAGPVGQAVALSVEADRARFLRCRFLGNQDTLYVDGANARQYFRDCYIEGTTDFIFGGATALFDGCTIHSKANSFITAASTPAGRAYGMVFLDCRLTAGPEVDAVYLGRPWRDYAKTVFIRCEMGGHIRPQGWDNWSTPSRERTTYYAEFGCSGPGAGLAERAAWSYQLTATQAEAYQPARILAPFALPHMSLSDDVQNKQKP